MSNNTDLMKKILENLGVDLSFFYKHFSQLILASEDTIPFNERAKYLFLNVAKIAPFAFVLDIINAWFNENGQFFLFLCTSVFINMLVGIWKHVKKGTFDYKQFLIKNAEMALILVITYVMLDMLRLTAGDNYAGEAFRVVIQVMTLFYPASKVIKNVYIISNGKYPAEWVMKRLYNFEKNGDLRELFSDNKTDIQNEHFENEEH